MSTNYLDASREQFKDFMALPIDGPLKMVNLLKFKKQVEGTNKTGAEVYKDYLKEATPFIKVANAKVIFMGEPIQTLIGPNFLEWDQVLIVEYPSRQNFVDMVTNEKYPGHIRKQALADSRLIFCQ